MKLVLTFVALLAAAVFGWTQNEFATWRKEMITLDVTFGMTAEDLSSSEDEDAAHEYIKTLAELIEKEKKTNKTKYQYEDKTFLDAKSEIEASEDFDVVRDMPKGAALNTDIFGMGSTDMLLEILMARNDVYAQKATAAASDSSYLAGDYYNFRFIPPTGNITGYTNINSITDADEYKVLKRSFTVTIPTDATCPDKQDVELNWKVHDFVKNNIKYLTTHHEVFDEYLRRSLQEMNEDGVDYIEIRSGFDELHGFADNKTVNSTEVAARILEIARSLIGDREFSSIRVIYTPARNEPDVFNKFVRFQNQLGTFLTGFDFDGREVEKNPLKQYNDVLNRISNFYKRLTLTAGNSLVAGSVEDANLLEAILVGPERINGGVSIIHHPYAIKRAKEKGITFVIDPIKYQLLGYGKSMKNHPLSIMMANGLNVVIAGGAPGMFGAKGVSHNYYYAMKATNSKQGGIKKLKKLIRHGISHNRMTSDERDRSFGKWNLKWKKQIRYLSGKKIRSG